jgi:hypothetical protein
MTETTPLRRVTKAEFFATVGPLNVHPRPERDAIYWEDQRTRRLVGRSLPGYLNGSSCEPSYFLA